MSKKDLKRFKAVLHERLKYESVALNLQSLIEEGKISKADLLRYQNLSHDAHLYLYEANKKAIYANPYLSNIKIPRTIKGKFTLANRRILPRETVGRLKESTRCFKDDTLAQENYLYYCDENLRFPALIEGESTCWMTVEPFEIETFEPFIKEAEGHVLLCGLGLGYVAYMLSLKPEVKSVTVVDLSQDVIDIFNEAILPQFENKDKITVVQGDAIEFMETTDLTGFDHVNVDVWRDTIDMLDIYLKCLEIESRNPSVKFSYWLEGQMKEVIQSSVIASLVGYDVDFTYSRTIADDITKGVTIESIEEFIDFVRMDDFRRILLEWHLKHKDTKLSTRTVNDLITTSKIINFEPVKPTKPHNKFDK